MLSICYHIFAALFRIARYPPVLTVLPASRGATCDTRSRQILFPGSGGVAESHPPGREQRICWEKSLATHFSGHWHWKSQEAMVMMTDRKKDGEKWSKKVKERMREARVEAEKRRD